MSKIYGAAGYYIEKLRWHIMPIVYKTKIPKLQDWTNLPFPTQENIKLWFEQGDANLGVITGKKSGIIVFDVDVKNNAGGMETLEELKLKYGEIPKTPTVTTPSGGKHFYFRYPDNIQLIHNRTRLFKGCDLKADGGQVILPPSINEEGLRYRWEDVNIFKEPDPFAVIPKWLLNSILDDNKTKKRLTKGFTDIIPEGERNDCVFSKACELRARGVSIDDAFAMIKGFNNDKCVPPLDSRELENIVSNAYKYENTKQKEPISINKHKMALINLQDLLAQPVETLDYVIDGLLPKGGVSVVVAKPKTGKSTIARQLALCVARGESFLGRNTCKGLVVYLALEERAADVQSHFKAMGANNETIKIYAGMAPVDGIAQVRKTIEEEKPIMVIVDTLARLAKINDLNDYSKTTIGLEPFLAMAREVKTHVCLLHHAKKGNSTGIDSILGSTGIIGTVDVAIFLDRGKNYRTISSIQRDGKDIEETVLTFDPESRTTSLGGSKDSAEIDRAKELILEFLSNKEEAIEEKLIDDGVDSSNSSRKKALRQLVIEGKVIRSGEGKKGKPYFYKVSGFLVPCVDAEPENEKSQALKKIGNNE